MNLKDQRARYKAKVSLTTKAANWKTICEVFRLIYDEVYNLQDVAKRQRIYELLTDGMIMGGAMYRRMRHLMLTYKDYTGKRGQGLEPMPNYKELETMRLNRK